MRSRVLEQLDLIVRATDNLSIVDHYGANWNFLRLVSARGVIPLSWAYDHVGPMTRSVRDAALVLQAIAGYDAGDNTSREFPESDYLDGLEEDTQPLRLGIVRQYFFDDLEPEVAAAINNALQVLETLARDLSAPPTAPVRKAGSRDCRFGRKAAARYTAVGWASVQECFPGFRTVALHGKQQSHA